MLFVIIVSFLLHIVRVFSICTHLPSGSCFVDCTRDRYVVVCENIDGNQLQGDLETFAGLNISFELHIWNSPAVERLGGTSFLAVQYLLAELEMQNVVNLQMFPEVKNLMVLKRLTIRNTPKLKYFPLELIPQSVERISLRRTGITEFSSERASDYALSRVEAFRIRDQTIRFLDQYFLAFPNIRVIEIMDCQVNVGHTDYDPRPFQTRQPLKRLLISNNTFEGRDIAAYMNIFHTIVNSVVVDTDTEIEISGNEFPIGKKTVKDFRLLAPIKKLSLRGSYFENYNTLESLFIKFTNLNYLDLGRTNLPALKTGIFRGLPSLEVLKLDGNNLRSIEDQNFFTGLEAKNFSVLILSDNNLRTSPMGQEFWAQNLTYYDLSGNDITGPVLTNRSHHFPKLEYISQARNRKTFLVSSNYAIMKTVTVIDLSCNLYRNITKDYFSGFPDTVRSLNLSFCPMRERDRPIVADDAFDAFPMIEELYMDRGYFRSNFLKKLQKMPPDSARALKVLHLAYNKIAYLHGHGSYFTNFTELEELNLQGNSLQSTGSECFQPLHRLLRLNLANNALFSIGDDDFAGLDSLEYLDLSGNKLLLIAQGSFDMLPSLRGLFLHDNSLAEDSIPLAIIAPDKGKNLTHLSIGSLPIRCIAPQLFTRFPTLKWLYLNDSIPLFADMDPTLDLTQQMKQVPVHPWAGLRLCETDRTIDAFKNLDENFVRIQINDANGLVYQDLYLHFVSCFDRKKRNIKAKVESTLCSE